MFWTDGTKKHEAADGTPHKGPTPAALKRWERSKFLRSMIKLHGLTAVGSHRQNRSSFSSAATTAGSGKGNS